MHGQRPIVSSVHGMVAAAHPLAAFAGARILREGGNAFDAAVAVAASLGVVEPFMSGMAGLGMATCYSAEDAAVQCLDFVPGVPAGFDPSGITKEDIYVGAKASGVPGNLAGWAAMASTYGALPLASLLEPAIALARDGFPITDGVASVTPEYWELRSTDPEWVRVYTDGGGEIPPGWILRQPDLADSLEQIAVNGTDHFYRGPLGEKITGHLRKRGGFLSMADLDRVEPRWVAPIHTTYRGLRVHTLPPPAEAFQCLLTLGILADVDMRSLTRDGAGHLDSLFRAVRIAAETRICNNRASAQPLDQLMSEQGLAALRARHAAGDGLTGRVQQWRPVTDPALAGRREHTTSLSTADAAGNMVCLTQSLGSIYGSGVVVPGTGVCMNNFLNWTDLDEASPNRLRPGEPIGMCLAPTISTCDGEPVLALGTPGSYGILHTQVQALVQYLDYGLPLQQAIEAPRARLWDGRSVLAESRISAEVLGELRAMGHDVQSSDAWTLKVGGMQAIERDAGSGRLTGAADPRRDGYAAAP